jgi:hypothetical protein
MYKRILLAYDGSDAGQKALLDCQDLAQWSGSQLNLIAVMPSAMSFVGLEGGVYDMELEEREKKKYRAVLDEGDGRGDRRDHAVRPQDGGRPRRCRPQAPGQLGCPLVARVDLRRADRACALQRAGRHHPLAP